jgi:hypothetical protein
VEGLLRSQENKAHIEQKLKKLQYLSKVTEFDIFKEHEAQLRQEVLYPYEKMSDGDFRKLLNLKFLAISKLLNELAQES